MAGKSAGKRGTASDANLSKCFGAKQEIAGGSRERVGVIGSVYERIGGVLYRKKWENGSVSYREVPEKDKRQDAIASSHQRRNGKHHFNLEETYGNVEASYWWEDIYVDVKNFVSKCKECKQKKKFTTLKQNLVSGKLDSNEADVLAKLNCQRASGTFCDVLLRLDGGSYPAHKAVLAAVSDFFLERFTEMGQGLTEKVVLDLKGFSKESFIPLLDCAYTSFLQFPGEIRDEVCALAKHLRMWKVFKMCKELQASHLLSETLEYDETCSKEEKHLFSLLNSPWTGSDRQISFYNLDNKQNILASKGASFPSKIDTSFQSCRIKEMTSSLKSSQKSEFFQDQDLSQTTDCATVALCRVELNNENYEPGRCYKLFDAIPGCQISSEVPSVKTLSSSKAISHFGLKVNSGSPLKSSPEDTSAKCKHLRFPHLLQSAPDCISENVSEEDMVRDCNFVRTPVKSPSRQPSYEDEVHSPNTAEKYKLLGVLGLRRKVPVPISNEEQLGWRQKKRLRKPKISNYTICSVKKKRKNDVGVIDSQGIKPDIVQEHNVDVKGIALKQTQEVEVKGLSPLKSTKAEVLTHEKVKRIVGVIKKKGNGWSRRKRRSNLQRLLSQSDVPKLCDVKPLKEECYVVSNQLTTSCPRKKIALKKNTVDKQNQKNQSIKMTSDLTKFSEQSNLPRKRKPERIFVAKRNTNPTVKNQTKCCKRQSADLVKLHRKHLGNLTPKSEFKKTDRRTLHKNRKVERKPKLMHGIKLQSKTCKPVQMQKRAKVGHCQQKLFGTDNKRERVSSCKLNLKKHFSVTSLPRKRKGQFTQKLLDNGIPFGFTGKTVRVQNACATKVCTANSQVRTKPLECKKKILTKFPAPSTKAKALHVSSSQGISQSRRKRKTFATAKVSEDATKSNVSKAKLVKTVLLYGKKLLNLKNKDSLIKKRKKTCTADMQEKTVPLSTSRKPVRLLEYVGTCSRDGVSSKPPKTFQEVSRSLKKKQSEILKSLQKNTRSGLKTRPVKEKPSRTPAHCCPACNDVFANCDALIFHRSKHFEGKTWPCPVCRKSFYRQRNVKIHLRSHEQNLFRCKTCKKD
ncbi:uncharacterized protein LOC122801873 [Protopterus annectens]|uniref:uncharacterized protein LOC122801873 n=1 Tax=Protopterus annectens TaxID=7888 RepID=UPI001CFB3C1C|nr:uncharacterized protein LOC122801873 [Protopterus annectens]